MYSCGFEPETPDHLRCKLYSEPRLYLLNEVFLMNQTLENFSDEELVNVLLYCPENFTFSTNAKILGHTIKFLKATKLFGSPLLNAN